ncbi:carbohydrate ABC transporter permease [Actinopolymorpha alba]|uniref:carbohydrate ABC transporter permease n=1 Tax=Actinopolymorpha alba TaxID=533267 RepID=UPI00035E06BC|nr:carbohydrate ABC transporter permease [Actinopolymorpha alba]
MSTTGAPVARRVITAWIYLIVLVFVLPFYWMVVLATHDNDSIYSFPPPLLPGGSLGANWSRLTEVVEVVRAMGNSILVASAHTVLVLLLSSLVGFGFSRFRSAPGARWMWRVVLATIFIPGLVGLIPWYVLIARLGWIDTLWPLIIPGAANGFAVFWMRQIITQTVPVDLYDAARIDGASDWRTYWTVVLPLIRPGLGALGIWTFMATWTAFQIPLIVLNSQENFTLPLALANLNTLYGQDTAAVMLGSVISVLPIFVAFLLAAKQFMAGLTAGALKG